MWDVSLAFSPFTGRRVFNPSDGGLTRGSLNKPRVAYSSMASSLRCPSFNSFVLSMVPFVCLTGLTCVLKGDTSYLRWEYALWPCGSHNQAPPHLSARSRVAQQHFCAGRGGRAREARAQAVLALSCRPRPGGPKCGPSTAAPQSAAFSLLALT